MWTFARSVTLRHFQACYLALLLCGLSLFAGGVLTSTPRNANAESPNRTALLEPDDSAEEEAEEKAEALREQQRLEAEVDDAIEEGITWLIAELQKEQMPTNGDRGVGQLALETYALLVAGVWEQHPVIQAAFKELDERAVRTRHIYTIACYIFALDAAIAQLEQDFLMTSPRKAQKRILDNPAIGKPYRSKLKKAVKSLVAGQNRTDLWRYHTSSQDMDNSVTQFAMLALGVAQKRGVKIPEDVWHRATTKLVSLQHPGDRKTELRLTPYDDPDQHRDRVEIAKREQKKADERKKRGRKKGRTAVKERVVDPIFGDEQIDFFVRGFGYTVDKTGKPGQETWNMTCSGVSSLLLARRALLGRIPAKERSELDQAIRDGYGWLMEHWTPAGSYYGMYSLEKVADIGGVKLFGGKDWFDIVRSRLLDRQEQDGGWNKGHGHGENRRVATAFALLILNRATTLLTSNPAKKVIVYSGGRTREQEVRSREWVYVPDLEVTLHYPEVLKQAKRRPSPTLVGLLAKIVDAYPPEFLPELMPEMTDIRKKVQQPALKKALDGFLKEMAGVDLGNVDLYAQWHQAWAEIEEISHKRDKTQQEKVLEYYKKAGDSLPAKFVAMRAIWDCKIREALPLYLDDLSHDNEQIREAAYKAFRRFFLNLPPKFNARSNARLRQEQIDVIREWYEENGASAVH